MFLLEYIKNPRNVGAVAPSSKYLANRMIESIDFKNAKCIVEFGPGDGPFSEKILAKKSDETIVVLVEINTEFYNKLVDLYGHKKNVIIVNDSAENIKAILEKNKISAVDYIVSGLPFASLPKKVSMKILTETAALLGDTGTFITFQYSLLKVNMFEQFFKNIDVKKVIRNLPPAYVLQCES